MEKFLKLFRQIFLLTLLVLVNRTWATCQLKEEQIRNEWRLLLLYRNNTLHTLREPTIENGAQLYMVCNEKDITIVQCGANGEFDVSLPLPACNKPLEAKMLAVKDEACPYQTYRVGFEVHCQSANYFFPTYRVCFDQIQMRTIYTINKAYPFVMRRPDGIRFDPDNIFTMRIFSAYNKRDIYGQFKKLLGIGQQYMACNENERRLDRGHMVPVADFMSNNLIASTFKMINVIPQFHTINAGNWNVLEEWARHPSNTPASVCSGVLPGVLELPNADGQLIPIYLGGNNLIPIPLWTYKIVLNRKGQRTVFLQYNNIHDTNVPKLPDNFCQQQPCPSGLCLRQWNFYGYTFCCEPEHFMKTHVPLLTQYC